jgi:hypothetical protein
VKKIIVGSTTVKKYPLSRRTPSDLDIWGEKGNLKITITFC